MNELEFKMLIKKKKKSSAKEELGEASDEDEDLSKKIIEDLKKNAAKRNSDVKDKVQFKRKKAKVLQHISLMVFLNLRYV